MTILQYPILIAFLAAAITTPLFLLRPTHRKDVILLILMVLLLALPRAGVFLPNVRLPLPLSHVITALLIFAWLMRLHRKHQHDRAHYFFLAYAIVACWGIGLGIATGGTLIFAFLEASFYFFVIGIFFFALDTFDQKRHFNLFISFFFIISVAVSLYGIAQSRYGSSILINRVTYNSASGQARSYVENEMDARRVLSSYGDPNVLAAQLVVFAAVALAVVFGCGNIAPAQRSLWLIAFILNVLCLYYTGSRAGMLALIIVSTMILAWRTKWILFLAIASGAYLIISGIIQIEGLAELIPENDMRRQFPEWAIQFIKGVPLGCGFGNSIDLRINHGMVNFSVIPAHTIWMGFNSFWLDLLSRLGLPGVAAFALLIGVLLYNISTKIRKIHDPYIKAILIGGIVGLFGQSLIWFANNTYILPGGGVTFWFMMGIFYAGARAYSQQEAPAWAIPAQHSWHWAPLAYTQ